MPIMQAVRRALALAFVAGPVVAENTFLPSPEDAGRFLTAIEAERPGFVVPEGVTGVTVPHHLLAADLMARGFWAASAGTYDRIVILAPDHFRLVPEGFAVDASDHETVLGPVPGDAATAEALAGLPRHPDIGAEHGVGALLPFVAHFFPGVPVVSVVGSVQARPEEWRAMADRLVPLIGPDTLVVQSTDYSHFLSIDRAILADMETLGVIAAGEPEDIATLTQPDHLDSQPGQYVQMRLQTDVYGASSAVIANRSSVDYGGPADDVTSYMVTIYHQEPRVLSVFDYADQTRFLVAGDVLTGRYFGPMLANAGAQAAILNEVTELRAGASLLANLEGVIVEVPVGNAPEGAHLMEGTVALPLLEALGISALGLSNNHSHDFGARAAEETARLVEAAGISALRPGEVVDLGAFRAVALNLLAGVDPYVPDLSGICEMDARPPLVVFVHWGKEYTDAGTEAEARLADQAARCGAAAVIGAHSHLASDGVELSPSGLPFVYSLGNFLFDQTGARASGAMAELRVFGSGTMAMRLIPVPNLFDLGRAAKGE